MIEFARRLDTLVQPLRHISSQFFSPVLDLVIRLFMASIFFSSGMLKFGNFLNGNWEATVFLFREAHPLPGIPPEIAAVAGTGGELILSALLALGLFGRFAAAGLLAMTATIEFLVPAEYGIMNMDHYLWMMLLAVPLLKGPGPLSLDYLILKWIRGS